MKFLFGQVALVASIAAAFSSKKQVVHKRSPWSSVLKMSGDWPAEEARSAKSRLAERLRQREAEGMLPFPTKHGIYQIKSKEDHT